MSVTATFWVRAQRVGKSSPKCVLIALADFANEDFRVWASMDAIEQFIEQDRKTILANIKRLKELGYLEDTGERTGRTGQIIVYQITRPVGASKVTMTNREGKAVEIGPPETKRSQIRNCSENGTVKGAQKRNSSKNGTVPDLDSNGPKYSGKQSQISAETVPNLGHGTTKELPEEQKGNDQLARRAPRVALHDHLRQLELPESIPADVWDMWCEHREAKHKDAPWTRGAARVSIKKLLKLAAAGQTPEVTVEEAVLRGWTGLFAVKPDGVASAAGGAQAIASDWWKSSAGIETRAAQLGVKLKDGETFMHFKVRVFKAAGPGEWMEDMLRTVGRESEERYEQLYAYFNDVPRDKNGNTEAA
ncbi:helix-turn-helix domain-containing protein [Caballeronia cordobensis]|uniref:helix-turn-helix domain-containing protein n=1 Tax=Caballeronia cordobensis TaxID=1353886 RepID=UPI00045EEEDD|nr:Gp60 protein [Burkholderia sp. RPE67]